MVDVNESPVRTAVQSWLDNTDFEKHVGLEQAIKVLADVVDQLLVEVETNKRIHGYD